MQVRTGKGFTLIELMITVSIVVILLVLAVPASIESIRKARRADATESLQSLATNQSQWRANHTTYAINLANVDYAGGVSGEGHYTIAFVGTPSATTFLVTAAPTGGQSTDSCGTVAINQDGPFTTGYANANCWSR